MGKQLARAQGAPTPFAVFLMMGACTPPCSNETTILRAIGGYIIGQDGIKMSPEKVDAVLSWKRPGSLANTQSFLGFANFYRQFIQNYLGVARPLTELTRGEGKNWAWNP